MKVGLLAYHLIGLEEYWEHLKDKCDCWWAVTQPELEAELRAKGIDKVVCCPDEFVFDENNPYIKYVSKERGKAERELSEKLDPDLWISDHVNRLCFIPKKVPWVETFHGFGFKKHIQLHREIVNFDLILLPGEFHKNSIASHYPQIPEEALQIVGWPRIDSFFRGDYCRETTLSNLGLDINKKTVFYAPTWGGYHGEHGLWGRWFNKEYEVFEQVCKFCQDEDLNFIVKLHGLSPYINDERLKAIAEKYNTCWVTKNMGYYHANPNEYLWCSDVLITDLSSIAIDFLALDRPLIFIDPDESLDAWTEASMPADYRAGDVVKTIDQFRDAIKQAKVKPDKDKLLRKQISDKVFSSLDAYAGQRAAKAILDFYNKYK